jgi:hypothetical protein
MAGSVIRGPALGMGLTIENIHWEGDSNSLNFEFNGQAYQQYIPEADGTTAIVEVTPVYTEAKAEWDSILLEGQVLKVMVADGRVIYQTNTTELRLGRPLIGGLSLGQAAAWMMQLGVAGSIVGSLIIFWQGRGIVPLIWIAMVIGYLITPLS